MTHARFPDFSSPSPTILRVVLRDPVLSAVEAHAEAWATFWCVPAGRAAEIAEDKMSAALEDLLATPCTSQFGALTLVRHLRWLIDQDAIRPETADLCGRLLLAREADLSRFAGLDLPPEELARAAPSGRLAATITTNLPPSLRSPLAIPALGRVLRAAGLAGEALTALTIIAGGVFAYGFIPFV